MIQIGVAEWCLRGSRADALGEARAAGLRVVQLDAGVPGQASWLATPAQLRETRQIAAMHSITISALALNFLNDDRGNHILHPTNWEPVLSIITAARSLAIPLIVVPWFDDNIIRTATDLESASGFLRHFCCRCRHSDIVVAAETTLGSAQDQELANRVGCENFRLLADLQNIHIFHDSIQAVIDASTIRADQVHVKDGIQGVMGNTQLGDGEAGIVSKLRQLLCAGFDGIFILENEYKEYPGLKIRQDIETILQLIEESNTAAHRQVEFRL